MKLIACISVSDTTYLEAAVSHLDEADIICVVGGPVRSSGAPQPSAAQVATRAQDLAEQDGRIKAVSSEQGWMDEVDKRNQYLIGEPGDWYLVVDPDELVFSLSELRGALENTTADSVCVPYFFGHRYTKSVAMPRVFRHLPGIRYKGRLPKVICDAKKLTDVGWAEGVIRPHKYGFRMILRDAPRETMLDKGRQVFKGAAFTAFKKELEKG